MNPYPRSQRRRDGDEGDDVAKRLHVLVMPCGIRTISERVEMQRPDAGGVRPVDVSRHHVTDVHRIARIDTESLEGEREDLRLRLREPDHGRVDDDVERDVASPQGRFDVAICVRHHADRNARGCEIAQVVGNAESVRRSTCPARATQRGWPALPSRRRRRRPVRRRTARRPGSTGSSQSSCAHPSRQHLRSARAAPRLGRVTHLRLAARRRP